MTPASAFLLYIAPLLMLLAGLALIGAFFAPSLLRRLFGRVTPKPSSTDIARLEPRHTR